jgi:hypothetical protein
MRNVVTRLSQCHGEAMSSLRDIMHGDEDEAELPAETPRGGGGSRAFGRPAPLGSWADEEDRGRQRERDYGRERERERTRSPPRRRR